MNVEVVARRPSPEVVEGLLAGLPEWFGIPEAAQQYVADAESLPALVAINDAGQPVGVLVHRRHFPESIEIHVMAVARSCHRQGVGRALVDASRRARLRGRRPPDERQDAGSEVVRKFVEV
jgi:GNAT superfamily N-acetyltransferase